MLRGSKNEDTFSSGSYIPNANLFLFYFIYIYVKILIVKFTILYLSISFRSIEPQLGPLLKLAHSNLKYK